MDWPDGWEVPRRLRMAALVAEACTPHSIRYDGVVQDVTPCLVPEIFGDGLQLIGLYPLATRPDYYLVRIDSGWGLDHDSTERVQLYDYLEDIYDAIEDVWGLVDDEDEEDAELGWFPQLDLSCGVGWFPLGSV